MYAYWDGNQWIYNSGVDLSEFESAIGSIYLEFSFTWNAIGNPYNTLSSIGIVTNQGTKFDYHLDDGVVIGGGSHGDINKSSTWQGIKKLYQ